jgi:hypothetical protein
METTTPKPTLIFLRVIFWIFWTGTIVLPVLCMLGISRRLAQFTDFAPVFYPMAFVCLIMLSLISAACVRSLPHLARIGIITVGFELLSILLVLPATADTWLVGAPS